MNTFFMFGTYNGSSLKGITAKRTEKARSLIEGFGGKLRSVYALLGDYDLVMVVELPGIQEAFHASVEISRQTDIRFTTCPAIPVADFDRMFG